MTPLSPAELAEAKRLASVVDNASCYSPAWDCAVPVLERWLWEKRNALLASAARCTELEASVVLCEEFDAEVNELLAAYNLVFLSVDDGHEKIKQLAQSYLDLQDKLAELQAENERLKVIAVPTCPRCGKQMFADRPICCADCAGQADMPSCGNFNYPSAPSATSEHDG